MVKTFNKFQKIVRNSHKFVQQKPDDIDSGELHPFEERNVHPVLDKISRKLFDDGHYSNATFEAYKCVDKTVQKLANSNQSGYKLMMQAFNETSPLISLTDLSTTSEIDEQQGYKFIFSGAVMAIRNPRGHEVLMHETPDQCLDHISLASLLLRRLDDKK